MMSSGGAPLPLPFFGGCLLLDSLAFLRDASVSQHLCYSISLTAATTFLLPSSDRAQSPSAAGAPGLRWRRPRCLPPAAGAPGLRRRWPRRPPQLLEYRDCVVGGRDVTSMLLERRDCPWVYWPRRPPHLLNRDCASRNPHGVIGRDVLPQLLERDGVVGGLGGRGVLTQLLGRLGCIGSNPHGICGPNVPPNLLERRDCVDSNPHRICGRDVPPPVDLR